MKQTLWQKLTYRVRFIFNHYLMRCCSCHSWKGFDD